MSEGVSGGGTSTSGSSLTARLRGNTWGIVIVLSLAYFMAQLDQLVLTLALPAIARSFHASLDQLVWAISIYILMLAVTLITAGRLGDLYGRRRMFLAGLALFTASSLGSGLAGNPAELITARAFQGLGAALLTPQTLALLVDHIPADRRGTALGVRGAVGGLAAVAGPVIGGLLVGSLGWHWVFLINVPIGVLSFALAWLVLPDRADRERKRIDTAGIALAALALGGFTFAVNQGGAYHWDGRFWGVLAGAAVVAAGFYVQQRRAQGGEPLVPFGLFADRNYSLMNGFSVAITMTVVSLILVLSVFFQSVAGYSPVKAGLVIMPASLFSMALDPLAGRLSDKVQGRYLLLFGAAMTVAGMLWATAFMHQGAAWPTFIGPMVVIGTGNAFLFTPLAAVALHSVGSKYAGAAAGVLVTALQIGSMAGAAVTGALLQGGSSSAPTYTSSRTTMFVIAVFGALAALTCLAVRPAPKPAQQRQQQQQQQQQADTPGAPDAAAEPVTEPAEAVPDSVASAAIADNAPDS